MFKKFSVALQVVTAGVVLVLAVPAASAQAKERSNSTVAGKGRAATGAPKAHAAGVESCAGVIAGIGGTVPGWVAAAISAPFCGKWLGEQNVRRICWESRQWWGYQARAFIRAVTWNRYSRC